MVSLFKKLQTEDNGSRASLVKLFCMSLGSLNIFVASKGYKKEKYTQITFLITVSGDRLGFQIRTVRTIYVAYKVL